jgi:hypothetical protein
MPVFFENRIGRTSTTVVDMRLLELRSGLFFEYPKLRLKDKNLIFFLPFFENPIITQSKEARLISYDLINQNSTLFSHVGAKAREISLTMTLTIPHIMRSINSIENSQRLLKTLSTETEKKRFGAKNILNPVEYVDVPCICKSYNITVEEAAGYDLKTLLPNRIVIQLDLAELRGGDFTSFSPGTPVKRDNMVGWESAIMYGTTDPGYLR